MADIWSKNKRSEVMALVRSSGNKQTELRLIEIFREFGIKGWRRNEKLPGKPDFVFRRQRLVVFIDGCFWHGCPKCYRRPQSNKEYWDAKVASNRRRDRSVVRQLKESGWKVVRLWQHQLGHKPRVAGLVNRALNLHS